MSPSRNPRRYRVLWLGLLVTVLGALSNGLYFLVPGRAIVPWINVLLPAAGLVVLLAGWRNAFADPQHYGGKIVAPVFAIFAVLVFGGSAWLLHHARDLPASAGAPQIGEKAPDFNLANANGSTTSLSQLLSEPMDGSGPPKAVLLVFYRGYW
jgi:hypothetical protein